MKHGPVDNWEPIPYDKDNPAPTHPPSKAGPLRPRPRWCPGAGLAYPDIPIGRTPGPRKCKECGQQIQPTWDPIRHHWRLPTHRGRGVDNYRVPWEPSTRTGTFRVYLPWTDPRIGDRHFTTIAASGQRNDTTYTTHVITPEGHAVIFVLRTAAPLPYATIALTAAMKEYLTDGTDPHPPGGAEAVTAWDHSELQRRVQVFRLHRGNGDPHVHSPTGAVRDA